MRECARKCYATKCIHNENKQCKLQSITIDTANNCANYKEVVGFGVRG